MGLLQSHYEFPDPLLVPVVYKQHPTGVNFNTFITKITPRIIPYLFFRKACRTYSQYHCVIKEADILDNSLLLTS